MLTMLTARSSNCACKVELHTPQAIALLDILATPATPTLATPAVVDWDCADQHNARHGQPSHTPACNASEG